MEQYPDLAGEMVAAGHEIGLHGYSHSCMSCMEEEMLEQELSRTEDLLWEQTGVQSSLLRRRRSVDVVQARRARLVLDHLVCRSQGIGRRMSRQGL